MQPSTIRTLAEYIAEHRRRDRHHYGTNGGGAFDTTIEINTPGDEGNRSGDERRDQDASGQTGY